MNGIAVEAEIHQDTLGTQHLFKERYDGDAAPSLVGIGVMPNDYSMAFMAASHQAKSNGTTTGSPP